MIKAIVTDIEGTTSSLSFVRHTLFPYAHKRMADFVRAHRGEPMVKQLLDDVRIAAGADLTEEQTIETLRRWIDEDRKITPLKALQGMIWRQGYERGEIKGHVYGDAVDQLRNWKSRSIRLYVFSSGSVLAQQLLFRHSAHGDLTPLFCGYFDTAIGAKKDAEAYRRIAAEIGVPAAEVLFLSDVTDELDAARSAGMRTLWVVRDGRVPADTGHRHVADFTAIAP